jgi:hypothetical protein
MIRDLALSFGAAVVATVLAELLGAANLGTALTFGAIAFMGTIVGLILARGPQAVPPPAPTEDERLKRPKPSGRPRA